MGTWAAGIFADDFACDVREAYLARLAEGEPPAAASLATIEAFGADGDDVDPDEGPIFWFALAATQWEYGDLDPHVRDRALQFLDAGGDALVWTEPGTNPRRRAALAALATKLRSPPPRPRRPRRRKPVEVPTRSVASPDGSATASVFAIGGVAQVAIEIPSLGGGGGVFAAECARDDVVARWLDDDTLEISYPASARVAPRPGDPAEYYLRGRTIALRFVSRDDATKPPG